MFKFRNTEPEPVCELNPANIYAGAVVGDSWVEMLLMHLDPMGSLCPIWSKRVRIDIPLHVTPSLNEVTRAMLKAWKTQQGPHRIMYNRFFLCLPAWASESVISSVQMQLSPVSSSCSARHSSVIDAKDIRRIESLVSKVNIGPNNVVVDIVPHGFVLDSQRKVRDPKGNISSSLRIDALLAHAELGPVFAILDCLKDHSVRVDVMMTPYEAHAGVLSDDHGSAGAVVDVGHRYTTCSFFQQDNLCYTTRAQVGSDNVHADMAAELHVPVEELDSYTQERQALLSGADPNHKIWSLPLFAWSVSHPAVRRLGGIAAASAEQIFASVEQSFTKATREMMLKVENVTVIGDDPLTARVLKDMLQERLGLHCRMATPDASAATEFSSFSAVRTCGFMRHSLALLGRSQEFLEHYNEGLADMMNRKIAERAAEIGSWMATRLSVLARRPSSTDTPVARQVEKHMPIKTRGLVFSGAGRSIQLW